MKIFITGGSGFVGRQLVARLLERGDDVYALARSPRSEAILTELGANIVPGDVMDVASMRLAMEGSDIVYHLAGISELGFADPIRMEMVNVAGTRKVLTLAYQLGVPRIIFMSSLAVNGDTHGIVATESYQPGGPFLTEVDRTKWLAHYQVAKPLIEKGAPIIILMPGVIYGPGDMTVLTQAMARFYFGTMPFIPAPSSTYSYVHVGDVVEAHLLAAERGKPGESYIIAGPAISQGEMFGFWSYLTGKPRPRLRVPAGFLKAIAPLVTALGKWVKVPEVYSGETLFLSGATYIASSEKAEEELGWEQRSLQSGMAETFAWMDANKSAVAPPLEEERMRVAGGLLGFALSLGVIFWLQTLLRRRK